MANTYAKILLVDDEEDILEFMSYNLRKEGYEVFTASNGKDALVIANKEIPQLIILDIMMPEMDGIETCRQLRETGKFENSCIAFLTARTEEYSQLAGFDVGADDYILKPIKPRLLVSRVKALLRRASHADEKVETQKFGSIEINREKYTVIKNGNEISLPRKEFELLSLLASKPGKVFTRESILANVWGDDIVVGDRTIDVHVRKIREKLGDENIRTIKGVGYKFDAL
jgi:two-component system alkaline phosphatase synthesis response regulator PhoP